MIRGMFSWRFFAFFADMFKTKRSGQARQETSRVNVRTYIRFSVFLLALRGVVRLATVKLPGSLTMTVPSF